jgi:hypothetical protein
MPNDIEDLGKQIAENFSKLAKIEIPRFELPSWDFAPPRLPDLPDLRGLHGLDVGELPAIDLPTREELHEYESAARLIGRLEERIREWRKTVPADRQPIVLAFLPNGTTVRVLELAEEGHSGVAVTAATADGPCLFLTHQASLQLLCLVEQVTDEKQRYLIGFRHGGTDTRA